MTQIESFIEKMAKINTESVIEIIEKNHYIIEHNEFKKITDTVINLNKEIERLRANEKVLVEALKYYADYETNADDDGMYKSSFTYQPDHGRAAQQALSQVKHEETI